MRRIRLLIEYDGTAYAGWQVQRADPTVQGLLQRELGVLTGTETSVSGASRTDSGVHAFNQVAVFDTSSNIPPEAFMDVLNAALPADIVIKDSAEVAPSFDPRRNSTGKRYLYKILRSDSPSALERRRAWRIYETLDLALMREGTLKLLGRKDFSSLMAAHSDAAHAVREVTSITISESGGFIEITIEGTAFLRHMVRNMVGLLVEVGRGKMKPAEVEAVIKARDRRASFTTAPAHGLYLAEVFY